MSDWHIKAKECERDLKESFENIRRSSASKAAQVVLYEFTMEKLATLFARIEALEASHANLQPETNE
jgi:hypothetical protein